MLKHLVSLFNKNEREVRRLQKTVNKINAFEAEIKAMSDDEIKGQKEKFKKLLESGKTLDNILPEAFATVREASFRAMKMRHFDVQLIGGIVLHSGKIAEMRTGEGKTLVATLAAYLNALEGKGVHIVTVNDYLAQRDSLWMQPLYESLGLSVGLILSQGDIADKKQAYQADITYGTNNEFGFDYLRDHMALSPDMVIQRQPHYAIVDEVDSILIDEARTPLIISGEMEDNIHLYKKFNQLVKPLKKQDFLEVSTMDLLEKKEKPEDTGDFMIDEKSNQIQITDLGHESIEKMLIKERLMQENDSLYSNNCVHLLHHTMTALRAEHLYHRDVHYLVRDNQVMIIDESTGRVMPGRRWSEGIHQAIEAKEKVEIQKETQTLASTSFQNYFRLYKKLSGMTGTADTEAMELNQIYKLDVVVMPTNKPVSRKDLNDAIYLTKDEKYQAIIEQIQECNEKGQPILIGTTSVESSEILSVLLNKRKILHQVLNAKQHEREAHIITEAGRPYAITLATNMAGRGTDIMLGGNFDAEIQSLDEDKKTPEKINELKSAWQIRHDQVIASGGLFVLGSERHESRRIDNQLRGRSGRQGDPGTSRFFLSMEDNLIRLFASDRVRNMMQKIGLEKGEAIEHSLINSSVERAQKKLESRNYEIRKDLLEYDDIANEQRKTVYSYREKLLFSESIEEQVASLEKSILNQTLSSYLPPDLAIEQYDLAGLALELKETFLVEMNFLGIESIDINKISEEANHKLDLNLKKISEKIPEEFLSQIKRSIMLQVLDTAWREHLTKMDSLRQGIHFRSYAQKNPRQEYKRESFDMFRQMLVRIDRDYTRFVMNMADERMQLQVDEQDKEQPNTINHEPSIAQNTNNSFTSQHFSHPDDNGNVVEEDFIQGKKIGRNDPCPCGSGKKYKKCCGKNI